jgi:SAM-dependent methyltransferase
MKIKNFVSNLHNQTKRDYLERMTNDKVVCMTQAKKYEFDYWDGERKFGYGGYKYIPGRWKPVAEQLINEYKLTNSSSILDVGCGKGFLLYEIKKILPKIILKGFDISNHGISESKEELKKDLFIHNAKDKFPFKDNEFDLVISLATLHNLEIKDLFFSLSEIDRVSIKSYIMVESYRNEQELFNLQCWALTCESFFSTDEWVWIFEKNCRNSDYEFIFFE